MADQRPPGNLEPHAAPIAALPARDLSCVHCDYNRRGLAPDGRCPECGQPIEASVDGLAVAAGICATGLILARAGPFRALDAVRGAIRSAAGTLPRRTDAGAGANAPVAPPP